LTQFGQSSDPKSPHFMDQAELLSKKQFKPELFYWDDVLAGAKQKYHPGEEVQTARK
jgi:acyl-homoserine lactone acylase PvdQ